MNQHQQQTTKQAIGVFDMAPFPLTGGLRKWRGTNRQFPEGKVSPFLFECYFKLWHPFKVPLGWRCHSCAQGITPRSSSNQFILFFKEKANWNGHRGQKSPLELRTLFSRGIGERVVEKSPSVYGTVPATPWTCYRGLTKSNEPRAESHVGQRPVLASSKFMARIRVSLCAENSIFLFKVSKDRRKQDVCAGPLSKAQPKQTANRSQLQAPFYQA